MLANVYARNGTGTLPVHTGSYGYSGSDGEEPLPVYTGSYVQTGSYGGGEIRCNNDIAPCLSVVMPVYNEAQTICSVVNLVLAQRPVEDLIVVDDASTDGSAGILRKLARENPRMRLFRHERNRGKGAALATGLRHARAAIVLIQDADLEYDPQEYHLLLRPIVTNIADVVYGSRFSGLGGHRVLYFWHAVGNRVLTTLSNMATNLNLTDMETCYKAFRREVVGQMTIEEKRFGFEPEVTAKVSKLDVRIYEVPISYHGRTYAQGKKINWRDGLWALWCIAKYNLWNGRGRITCASPRM